MKLFTLIILLLGLTLATFLIVTAGADQVVAAVASLGFGLLFVTLARLAVVSMAATAWWVLLPSAVRPRIWVCLALKMVREGANNLLPVAQVGGEVIGARLMQQFGVPLSAAGAGIGADVLIQAGTQFLFTFIGLGVLAAYGGDQEIVQYVGVGLLIVAPLLIGFFVFQGPLGHSIIQRLLRPFIGDSATVREGIAHAFSHLREIYADRTQVTGSIVLHFMAWMIGTAEVWIALHFMGHPVTWGEALVIESLGQAVRSAAFVVPGAIGVQEGGFVALCAVFGIPIEQALALSLVKRVADLALGVPGLIGWQILEGRTLFRRRSAGKALPDGQAE